MHKLREGAQFQESRILFYRKTRTPYQDEFFPDGNVFVSTNKNHSILSCKHLVELEIDSSMDTYN